MISAKEISKNIKEISKTAAPGPDKITLRELTKIDPHCNHLRELFNLWLLTGMIPDSVKNCRTVLIAKSAIPERLGDINNWRPITIGSIILRLFSRIITSRLAKACPINPRQRGFIRSAGCSENLKLLQLIIRHAKSQHQSLGVVFVDLAKAFDTVSHAHIISALEQRGVDQHIIALIKNMYHNVTTNIPLKGGHSDSIKIQIGVKQGDPMSPLLFNLAVDPLLCKLQECGEGFQIHSQNITALAFADDLVLLSNSWEGMMKNIEIVETFCNLTGLKTQGEKCHGFYIQPTKDSYKINDCPAWPINGTPLNMIDPGSSEKYLGMNIDPWVGISKPELLSKVKNWLHRIDRAPLKPFQKVEILRTYAMPRLIYSADQANVKITHLETLDQEIRSAVKQWLHLPPSTCDAILYASNRDGGFGLLRFSKLIPSVQARRLHRLAQSPDEVITTIVRLEGIEKEYEKLWVKAGGRKDKIPSIWDPRTVFRLPNEVGGEEVTSEWEAPAPKNIYPKPCNWRKDEFNNWTKLASQDMIFVKDKQALVVDVTIRYESNPSSLSEAAAGKVQKYKHLTQQVQELTNATQVKFVGFPIGARELVKYGKEYEDTSDSENVPKLSAATKKTRPSYADVAARAPRDPPKQREKSW
ncbi:mitochondrial enolase superfamily member 1, partial [Apus apus]|uniref:mitochondrial enolase superfamily member 1 n=1 Tax=Apus apus TaxID=8895 RepID=UPI0021F81FC2